MYSCTTDAALAAAELVWRVAGAEVLEQETTTSEEARWADIKISTQNIYIIYTISTLSTQYLQRGGDPVLGAAGPGPRRGEGGGGVCEPGHGALGRGLPHRPAAV